MRISVLIGTRDRPQALRRCLSSIDRQQGHPYETIVLDDASREGEVASIVGESEVDPIEVYRSEEPLGVAEMRNQLAAAASGDVLFFIDDDARLSTSCTLSNIAKLFSNHPQTAVIAARITDQTDEGEKLNLPFPRTALAARPSLAETAQCVSYFVGAGHAIRRTVFKECEGYASFLHFGESELDLSYRILALGYRIRYAPCVRVVHEPGASPLQSEGERSELYYHVRNRLYLAWRYIPAIYLPTYLCYWILAYGVFALRMGNWGDFLKGAVEGGYRVIREWSREPIDARTVAYLQAHYGRLWR